MTETPQLLISRMGKPKFSSQRGEILLQATDNWFLVYPVLKYYQINSISLSVCARGLDVKKLVLVVNYDCPNHYEDYVHRYLSLLLITPTKFLLFSKNLEGVHKSGLNLTQNAICNQINIKSWPGRFHLKWDKKVGNRDLWVAVRSTFSLSKKLVFFVLQHWWWALVISLCTLCTESAAQGGRGTRGSPSPSSPRSR